MSWEYPEYLGKSSKSSSEMAKFARSVQENPESFRIRLEMHAIKKINHKYLIEVFSYTGDV